MALPASKSAKNDLLVRVRYPHSLPPPPFPPKLLTVKSDPKRFSNHDFLKAIEDERELPMVADVELGMPIEVGANDPSYWETGQENYPPGDASTLDPEDQELLGEPTTSSNSILVAGGKQVEGARKQVDTFLRKTDSATDLSKKTSSPSAAAAASSSNTPLRRQASSTSAMATKKDIKNRSRQDRIKTIKKTFDRANAPLSSLRHPTKKHLTAIETMPVLPSESLWPNNYHIFRFTDPPQSSVKYSKTSDITELSHRFESALFRPIQTFEGNTRVAYFLLPDRTDINTELQQAARAQQLDSVQDLDPETIAQIQKRTATEYLQKRKQMPTTDDHHNSQSVDPETFEFSYARDYEVANDQDLKGEFVINYKNDPTNDNKPSAQFALLQTSSILRKRRPQLGNNTQEEAEDEFWHGINIKLGGNPEHESRQNQLDAFHDRAQTYSNYETNNNDNDNNDNNETENDNNNNNGVENGNGGDNNMEVEAES